MGEMRLLGSRQRLGFELQSIVSGSSLCWNNLRFHTSVANAVLPAPLGPKRRKLLEGGEATLRKKTTWRSTGTPKVKSTAIAIATRLPSKSRVATPVAEFQPA